MNKKHARKILAKQMGGDYLDAWAGYNERARAGLAAVLDREGLEALAVWEGRAPEVVALPEPDFTPPKPAAPVAVAPTIPAPTMPAPLPPPDFSFPAGRDSLPAAPPKPAVPVFTLPAPDYSLLGTRTPPRRKMPVARRNPCAGQGCLIATVIFLLLYAKLWGLF
jgi:hypothetical protein